jgi:hypothetical protein
MQCHTTEPKKMRISRIKKAPYIRFVISMLVGVLVGIVLIRLNPYNEASVCDMMWAINAARDLWAGRDPYRHAPSIDLVPYPLTSAIIVFPIALFPSAIGLTILFGIVSACLAYILIRKGEYWRLIVFVSPAYFMSLKSTQWSPLFMLVLFLPFLAPILLAKPTLALPIALLIRWSPMRLLTVAIVVAVSFIVMPDWIWRWIGQTSAYDGFVPLFSWFGPFFLISILFWQNLSSRLFFLMTITPQHRFFYDQLLLWLIPQTRRQMLVLTVSSWIGFYYIWLSFDTLWVNEMYLLATTYLPAFLIVLWQQPVLQQRFCAFSQFLLDKNERIEVYRNE